MSYRDIIRPLDSVVCRCFLHRPEHLCRFVREWLEEERDCYQGIDHALSRRVIDSLLERIDPTVSTMADRGPTSISP